MNPGLWINLMSQHRITVTGCPNFGLALVLRYLNRKKTPSDWDLSGMKAMLNGPNPFQSELCRIFGCI